MKDGKIPRLRFSIAVLRVWGRLSRLIGHVLQWIGMVKSEQQHHRHASAHSTRRLLRLLVVARDEAVPDPEIDALFESDEVTRCTRATWKQLDSDSFHPPSADLIVALAAADDENMARGMRLLRSRFATTPILVVLPAESHDTVPALLTLVDDFLVRPIRLNEWRQRVSRLIEPQHDDSSISERLLTEMALMKLVGRDPAFLRAVQQLPRFARFDMLVLITGETGTGKELCARAMHHLSPRRDHPFLAVDCAALPDTLFENEMFGHERGAFTDAHRAQKGIIASCDGGTLLLDEIDALSLAAQAKLLRFLQEHTYRPLGGNRIERANVRVLAATNRDLETCVKAGQLRPDLYFRLNVLRLHLPALRDRPGDIPLLAQSMLREFSGPDSVPTSFSPAALRLLAAHSWPGNVRELGNVVQRAIVNCEGPVVHASHIIIGDPRSAAAAASPADLTDFRTARRAALDAFERRYVEDLLHKHNGNVTHAAREAQQDRRAFGRFIKKHQIKRIAV